MTYILKAEKIVKTYGTKKALKSVDMVLEPYRCLAVLGPNGAGKSTLLNIISSKIKPDNGKIFFKGKEVAFPNSDYRKSIGVVSHQSYLYPALTALENICFYGSLYDIPDVYDKAMALLKLLEMQRYANDVVGGLSRGMTQRISIARALISSPEILLFDEPYTGLDYKSSEILSMILKEFCSGAKSVMIVTHNLAAAGEVADKILVLVNGSTSYNSVNPGSLDKLNRVYTEALA